jgi:hypothetical protein
MNTQIQWLIDSIVNNRNPESRAGCALSFGTIYAHVGSLIGGPLLKTMVNVLFSLANDPHPVVHFWSMQGLARVISSASLSYEPFVQSTLGQLANIYGLDTHEPEGGSVGSVNIRGDLPAYQVVCQILSAMVGVVGPELQEAGAVRSLIFLLVNEFSLEEDDGISVEAIKCSQQFLMFAPSSVDVPKLVSSFRLHLVSPRRPLKVAAINALYQLVQRDAPLMSKLGGNQLVEDLFGLLDDDPSIDGVRDVISNWAKQTSAASPSGWIDLCQRIMNRTTASQQVTSTSTTSKFQDDEAEGIVTSAEVAKAAGLRTTSRWRTQLFALRCLHEVILAVVAAGHPEQLNPVLAREMQLNPRATLVSRVGDLIRMAFSASTAQVTEIRLQGLIVLRDVIQVSFHIDEAQLSLSSRIVLRLRHSSARFPALLCLARSRLRRLAPSRAASSAHRRGSHSGLCRRLDARSPCKRGPDLRCLRQLGCRQGGRSDGKDLEVIDERS